MAFQTSAFMCASSDGRGSRSSVPIAAIRTVLWPISVAKLIAAGCSRSAPSAAPTSSAELPQLPATIVVTPIRTKFDAAGRSLRLSACVWTSMKPGATIKP